MRIKDYDKELKKIEKISKLINESNAIKKKIKDIYIKTYVNIKKNINSKVIEYTLWQEKKNILCKSSQKIHLLKLPLLCYKLISEYHDICTIKERKTMSLHYYGIIPDLENIYSDIYDKINKEWYNSNSEIYKDNYCIEKIERRTFFLMHRVLGTLWEKRNKKIYIHCIICKSLLHSYENTDNVFFDFADKDYYNYNRDSYCIKCFEDNVRNPNLYNNDEAYNLYKRKK